MPAPDLTGRPVPVAQVEQALIVTAIARAGDQIGYIDRYSTRPDPPAVCYGATIGFRDGWKLFLSCHGTTRPGQPRPTSSTTPPATFSLTRQPWHATRARREAEW